MYLALLALLYAVLTLHVIRLRQGNRAAFGDGDQRSQLRSAIRAHANFIEYVPIVTLMVAFLEMSGASAIRIHLLMGAAGLAAAASARNVCGTEYTGLSIGRVGGMTLTIGLLIGCALMILSRLALSGSNSRKFSTIEITPLYIFINSNFYTVKISLDNSRCARSCIFTM